MGLLKREVPFPVAHTNGLKLATAIVVEGIVGRLGIFFTAKERGDVMPVDLSFGLGGSTHLAKGGEEIHGGGQLFADTTRRDDSG